MRKLDYINGRLNLVRRIPQDAEAPAKGVMNAGDKAAQHLTLAWNAVDGPTARSRQGLRRGHQGDGGRDHSGGLPRQPSGDTWAQAEAAVHLAVTVVQWFNTGVITAR